MELMQLFFSFFEVGLFSFGGGMAAIPLIQQQVVVRHGWLTMVEFTDLVTIAEMTPGPIGVNAATFVGIRLHGLLGAVVATAGCILPSCCIVSLLAWVYFKHGRQPVVQSVLTGLRPAVVALIAASGFGILKLSLWGGRVGALSAVNPVSLLLMTGAFLLLRLRKPNPILVMCLCGALGLVLYQVG